MKAIIIKESTMDQQSEEVLIDLNMGDDNDNMELGGQSEDI